MTSATMGEQPRGGVGVLRPSIALLGVLTAIDAMSIDSYIPALPAIARDLSASAVGAQGTLSIFLVGIAIGQALWGPVSDRYGRRAPLLAGLVIYCVGSLASAIASSVEILMAARFLQAIGASSGLVLGRAIVSDLWPESEAARIYSVMMQVLGVTALFSPLLGAGMLQLGSWRLIFVLLLLVGLVALVWCIRKIGETFPPVERVTVRRTSLFAGYRRLGRNLGFVMAMLSSALATATMFATLAGSSFLFVDYFGWTSGEFSALYAASSLAFIAVCQLNDRLLRTRSDASLLKLAASLQLAIATLLLPLLMTATTVQVWGFAVLWVALMANLGILLGNAVAVAMRQAPREDAGAASGLIGVAQFAVSALIAPFASVSENLALSFAITTAVTALAAWLATLYATRLDRRVQPGEPELFPNASVP